MPKNRSAKDRMMLPGTIDRMIVDTFRGQYRVRKWPKKRGTPTDPIQLQRIQRFADANKLAKFVQGALWVKAMKQAKGTGLYPRDVIVQAMLVGQADIAEADGTLITYKRFYLEPEMFQGCRVQRNTNAAYTNPNAATVNWQQPIIQTVPMWNVALPSRITVPTGVNIVSLNAGLRGTANISGWVALSIRRNGADIVATISGSTVVQPSLVVQTGPLYVNPGDYFEVRIQSNISFTIEASERLWFAMKIENTTI